MEPRESTPRNPTEQDSERLAFADGVRFLPPADEYQQRLDGIGATVPREPAAADRRRLSGSIASTVRTRRRKG